MRGAKVAAAMRVIVAMAFVVGAAGCSETWRGVKNDTRENVETVGKGVEKTGEKIQDSVK